MVLSKIYSGSIATCRKLAVNSTATQSTSLREADMSKGMDSKKNAKKKPLKTPAEKKAEKKAKKVSA